MYARPFIIYGYTIDGCTQYGLHFSIWQQLSYQLTMLYTLNKVGCENDEHHWNLHTTCSFCEENHSNSYGVFCVQLCLHEYIITRLSTVGRALGSPHMSNYLNLCCWIWAPKRNWVTVCKFCKDITLSRQRKLYRFQGFTKKILLTVKKHAAQHEWWGDFSKHISMTILQKIL